MEKPKNLINLKKYCWKNKVGTWYFNEYSFSDLGRRVEISLYGDGSCHLFSEDDYWGFDFGSLDKLLEDEKMSVKLKKSELLPIIDSVLGLLS